MWYNIKYSGNTSLHRIPKTTLHEKKREELKQSHASNKGIRVT